MPKLFPLGFQIKLVVRVGRDSNGDLLNDPKTITFQPNDLLRVVGQQPNRLQSKIGQDLRTQSVFPQIHWVSELAIRLNSIVAILLEFVGLDLWRQPDAAAFLA